MLDNIGVPDGIPIRIVVKPQASSTIIYNFRQFHHKKQFNGSFFSYEIDGYLDFPKYWMGTSNVGIQGTSSSALASIANTCGLQFNGASTNDAQLWLPRNQTYAEFACSIADRGYITDSSYVELGVDFTGTLIYKDVNNLPTSQYTITLGQLDPSSFTASDYEPVARSGIVNKMTGYQNTKYGQSISSQTASTSFAQLAFTPDTTAPLYNTAMVGQIDRGYLSYGGLDVGNTHENYDKAKYQNLRYSNLYSLDVKFLMRMPTGLNLFDTFTFSVDSEATKQDKAYAGTYIVSARSQFMTGANFAEMILGTRTGTNGTYISG